MPITGGMDERTTWLCPTPLHASALLEMEAKLGRPRALMYGSLALAFLAAVPWIGVVADRADRRRGARVHAAGEPDRHERAP